MELDTAFQQENKKEMEIFGYVAILPKILKIGKMFALGFKNPWHN